MNTIIKKTNILAQFSLVLSVIEIIMFFYYVDTENETFGIYLLFLLVGTIVLGALSLVSIKKREERGLARAIISIILAAFILLLLIVIDIETMIEESNAVNLQKDSERAMEIAKLDALVETLSKENVDAKSEVDVLKQTVVKAGALKLENNDYAILVREWAPIVAHIVCSWDNEQASGSGVVAYLSNEKAERNGIQIMTNGHMLINDARRVPTSCKITLPGTGVYYANWSQRTASNLIYYVGVGEDYGYINILNSDDGLKSLTSKSVRLCSNADVGDKVLILGYPGIGSNTGITVTEGIISGFDGNYYITSAKIDHGNSGGAAVLVKENCYLGIPTSSVTGEIESLGRILKASFVVHQK